MISFPGISILGRISVRMKSEASRLKKWVSWMSEREWDREGAGSRTKGTYPQVHQTPSHLISAPL